MNIISNGVTECFHPKIRNRARMFVLIPLTQHSTGIPVSTIRIKKKSIKSIILEK